jgi:hypothetical protein
MKKPIAFLFAATLASVAILPLAKPAQADTTSTVLLATAAAAIVGAILIDANHQPYYVDNGRHIYVSQNTATYYRAHGHSQNYSHQNYDQHYYDQQQFAQLHSEPQHSNGQAHYNNGNGQVHYDNGQHNGQQSH